MPVVARGKQIVEKNAGKVVGTAKSHENAVKSARARNAASHRPTRGR